MPEMEIKLAVESSYVMPRLDLEELGIAEVIELDPRTMRTTYYDTDDLRLARSGVTLRRRTGEPDGPKWTLKLPNMGKDVMVREEQHFDGLGRGIPSQARDLLTAYARESTLASAAAIKTHRRGWLLASQEGKELAEIVDDEVSVLKGRNVVGRFRELEVESRGIDSKGLKRIARALEDAGAIVSEPIPKSVRALGAGATAPPDVSTKSPPLGPSEPAAVAVQAALGHGLRRLIAHDPAVRVGRESEAVHQMRVACRRLRSDLRTFGPLLDEDWAQPLTDYLRWLGDALGAVRDVEVQQERFHKDGEGFEDVTGPLFGMLAARHQDTRDRLMSALRSSRYKRALEELIEAAAAPRFTPRAQEPCASELPPLVEGAWQKLAKKGRDLSIDDPDDAYHEVRIRAKRARYAAEAAAPALDGSRAKAARRFAKRCEDLQGLLGDMQDAVVAAEILWEAVDEHPRSGHFSFVMGRLAERQQLSRLEARRAFPEGWKALDRKKNLSWFDA